MAGGAATSSGGPPAGLRTHPPEACAGRACCIHNPSAHPMRDWPMHWRADRYLMERICPHGVGHPDPDHIAHIARTLGVAVAAVEAVHGCCFERCCIAGGGT